MEVGVDYYYPNSWVSGLEVIHQVILIQGNFLSKKAIMEREKLI